MTMGISFSETMAGFFALGPWWPVTVVRIGGGGDRPTAPSGAQRVAASWPSSLSMTD